jgi:hypothetical protein
MQYVHVAKIGAIMKYCFPNKIRIGVHVTGDGYYFEKLVNSVIAVFVLLMMSGCATTSVDSQWSNPDFAGRKLTGKVLIIGVSREDTIRRLYEDEMAAQLAAHAVTTTRSHEIVTGSLTLDSTAALIAAAKSVGATAILSSAVVDRQHVERIVAEPLPMYGSDFSRWYGFYWPYAYSRTEVRSFERYTVSTSLTDVATGKIMWSTRTETESSDHVDREIKPFVTVITKVLVGRGLL